MIITNKLYRLRQFVHFNKFLIMIQKNHQETCRIKHKTSFIKGCGVVHMPKYDKMICEQYSSVSSY